MENKKENISFIDVNIRELTEKAMQEFPIDCKESEIVFENDPNCELEDFIEEQVSVPDKYIITDCEMDEIIEDINVKMRELLIIKLSNKEIHCNDIRKVEIVHEDFIK